MDNIFRADYLKRTNTLDNKDLEDIKARFKLVAEFPARDPKLEELMKYYLEELAEKMCWERKCEEEIVRYMLRYQVTPPIKGEITKGKIRWRGISIARFHKDNIS